MSDFEVEGFSLDTERFEKTLEVVITKVLETSIFLLFYIIFLGKLA